MNITWLGHACFLAEEGGYRLILDPYQGVEGLADISETAHAVLMSHQHYDHNYAAGVQLLPWEGESPFSVTWLDVFHDDAGGARRGPNRIHILTAGGVSLAHLGDLGHPLSPEHRSVLGRCQAICIPIGGTYTLDAAAAAREAEAIGAPVVIPMHYRAGGRGIPGLQTVEDFLALRPAGSIRRYDGSRLTLTRDAAAQTAVLACP